MLMGPSLLVSSYLVSFSNVAFMKIWSADGFGGI